jgi:hypothetical protein
MLGIIFRLGSCPHEPFAYLHNYIRANYGGRFVRTRTEARVINQIDLLILTVITTDEKN